MKVKENEKDEESAKLAAFCVNAKGLRNDLVISTKSCACASCFQPRFIT